MKTLSVLSISRRCTTGFALRAGKHQTVPMTWVRARDWLIGAVGMLLVLAVAIGILFWVVSEPASGAGAEPAPPSTAPEALANAEPPADLGEDALWLGALELTAGKAVVAGSILRDVRATGQDVVTGPGGMTAAQLAVDVTVPFDVVAGELGDGTEVRAADNGQVVVLRTVPAFGRNLPVVATGTVEAQEGKLVVEPRSIDLGGPAFLADTIAGVVRGLVTIEHEIEGLPEGLVLQDVRVQDDGFRAAFRGEHVNLGS